MSDREPTTTPKTPSPNGHHTANGATDPPAKPRASKKSARARRAAARLGPPADQVPPPQEAPDLQSHAPASDVPPAPLPESSSTPQVPPPPIAASIPVETPAPLRLRMKVWTHPQTGQRYLMPTAYMRDVVNGQPVSDLMIAYAMRDDSTLMVNLTAAQWNALPFFYFDEDGPAPRAAARPLDAVGGPRRQVI